MTYHPDALVSEATMEMVRRGFPILQSHKLADTNAGHIATLLEYFDPPQGASVLDAGCGVGAVADMMLEMRPDLRFTLLNISPSQLALCGDFPKIEADFHDIPCEDETFDAVMFNFALGHGDLEKCIAEASRVLKPGGILFLYELTADPVWQDYVFERVHYRPYSVEQLRKAGTFIHRLIVEPASSADDCIALLGLQSFVGHGFDRMHPVIARFVK